MGEGGHTPSNYLVDFTARGLADDGVLQAFESLVHAIEALVHMIEALLQAFDFGL
jgi:hypothetical protein